MLALVCIGGFVFGGSNTFSLFFRWANSTPPNTNRIRNKAKLKPAELVDPRNTELIATLQKAEFAMMAGDDVVGEEEQEGPTGSASDSE